MSSGRSMMRYWRARVHALAGRALTAEVEMRRCAVGGTAGDRTRYRSRSGRPFRTIISADQLTLSAMLLLLMLLLLLSLLLHVHCMKCTIGQVGSGTINASPDGIDRFQDPFHSPFTTCSRSPAGPRSPQSRQTHFRLTRATIKRCTVSRGIVELDRVRLQFRMHCKLIPFAR